MEIIVPLSFGKDSTTMADLMLKNNMQVDYLIFTDTLMEFPEMYDYSIKVCEYFKRVHKKEVIILKPNTTFEEWCFGVIRDKNAEHFGYMRGIPAKSGGVCYWRRESKIRPIERWIKKNIKGEYKKALGYTNEEKNRIQKDPMYFYPLIETFNMSEIDCKNYLIDNQMENPLYRFFSRTGCDVCPFQSDKAYQEICKHFPKTWEYMKWIEQRLEFYEQRGMKVLNKHWRDKYRTLSEMEKQFQSTFDFDLSDEPLKDCFCHLGV